MLEATSIWTVPVLDDGSPGEMVSYVISEVGFIPDGLALDADGRVYVTDALTNSIVRVEPDGTVVLIAIDVDTPGDAVAVGDTRDGADRSIGPSPL